MNKITDYRIEVFVNEKWHTLAYRHSLTSARNYLHTACRDYPDNEIRIVAVDLYDDIVKYYD